MIRHQPSDQKITFQNVKNMLNGMVGGSQRPAERGGIENASMRVGEHTHKTAHLKRGYFQPMPDHVAFNKRSNIVLLPGMPFLHIPYQKRIRKTAPEPERHKLNVPQLCYFTKQKAGQVKDANPSCQTFGNAFDQFGADGTKKKKTSEFMSGFVNQCSQDREDSGNYLGFINDNGPGETTQGKLNIIRKNLGIRRPFKVKVLAAHTMSGKSGFAALARSKNQDSRELPSQLA